MPILPINISYIVCKDTKKTQSTKSFLNIFALFFPFRPTKVSLLHNKCFSFEVLFMFPRLKLMFLHLKLVFLALKLMFHARKKLFLCCNDTFLIRFHQINQPKSYKNHFELRTKVLRSHATPVSRFLRIYYFFLNNHWMRHKNYKKCGENEINCLTLQRGNRKQDY